uniref:Thiol:disulfi de interchange protein n=1 Tax=Dermonema virens TaxID=1077399 RepID=A0A1G4NRH0_9FLOR|nr:Thiol:disulfi de interchange protein [Dermonema virens]SCW21251.1 Thiol:disulfi de interchange protein [Dermonema virens]
MNNILVNMYSLQSSINTLLINNINHISLASSVTAFTGGVLTSISPCVISSLPIATLYINSKSNKISSTVTMFTGILTSFLSIGIISILLRDKYWQLAGSLPLISPFFLIIIGMSLIGAIPISFLDNTNISVIKKYELHNPWQQAYFTGLGIGLAISPCSTPITITLLAWINSTENYITGIYLLLIYLCGYMMPFVVLIISINNFPQIKILSKYSSISVSVVGCIIMTTGSFTLFKEIFRSI